MDHIGPRVRLHDLDQASRCNDVILLERRPDRCPPIWAWAQTTTSHVAIGLLPTVVGCKIGLDDP